MPDTDRERRALELFETMLEIDEAERVEWLRRQADGDPLLAKRVTELAAVDRVISIQTGGAFDEVEETAPPERIGAYRIGELIGTGGMGSVYAATRDRGDFEHEVAIKLVKPGLLSEQLVERFARERQLLAQFSHPNIARLFDGGETEDGQPYIVMERIHGVALDRWLERADGPIDERLRLFLKVCDAVSHAHRHLVIHRDLTPANILVDGGGEPRLIDFGIARPEGEEIAPLTPGEAGNSNWRQLTLTPGYAAPERLRGQGVTTLSDVFSAGRLLNFLVRKPRDPELQAISNKAIADDPADRYQSMAQLAEDVQRYCDRKPVLAVPPSLRYSARKWIARNRGLAALGASLATTLLVALVSSLYLWTQAETAREREQRRFAETRAIARTMMFDVYDAVDEVPGSVQARALLADTALKYLDSLAADTSADTDLRLDAALGYFRLAEVVGARTGGGTLGETARAKPYYERSRGLLEQLHAEFSARDDIRAALGRTYSVMADNALFSDGDVDTATGHARRARALLLGLATLDNDSAAALAATYLHEGNALAFAGKPTDAGKLYERGFSAIEGFSPALKSDRSVKRTKADLFRMSGAYHTYFNRTAEARAALERSLAIWRSIASDKERDARDTYGLVTILQSVAQMELGAGNLTRADKLAQEAVDLSREGIAASPNDVGPKELFTVVAIFQARILAEQLRNRKAADLAGEAIAMKRSLVAKQGNVVSGPMTLAIRLQEASEVYLKAGERTKACAIMRESVGIIREFEQTAELPVANRTRNLEPMLKALRECPTV